MVRQDVFQNLKDLKLCEKTNLLTYVCLKGTLIMSLKWQGKEGDYARRKKELLEEVCKLFRNINLQHVKEVLNQVKEALIVNGYQVKVCRIKAVSRVVVGISEPFGQIPFEIGLFFDPILNVPFIPGSSIKGALRHALIELIEKELRRGISEKKQEKEIEKKIKEVADIIFGCEEWSGLVGVTDAYPVKAGVNGLIFEPDVLTPHYPSARTELDVTPIPIPFLTIARDVEFEFFIYFNKSIYELEHDYIDRKLNRKTKRNHTRAEVVNTLRKYGIDKEDFLKNIIKYVIYGGDLERALENIQERELAKLVPWVDRAVLYAFAKGIGAKTSIGYSRFIVVKYTWA